MADENGYGLSLSTASAEAGQAIATVLICCCRHGPARRRRSSARSRRILSYGFQPPLPYGRVMISSKCPFRSSK